MKLKIALLIISILLSRNIYSQTDTITVKHKNYESTFDRTLHYPVLVHWIVTKDEVNCSNKIPRDATMYPDPLLEKYTRLSSFYANSGYDKGHNSDAADNACDKVEMDECFYFSNMTPQTPNLNRGIWKKLEERTRKLAVQYGKVEVWCGSYGFIKKIGIVTVPEYCWKIIKYNGTVEAYIMSNHQIATSKTSSISEIIKITHLKILIK